MAKDILLDNSRQYGNGLSKFEPNDINKGYVADLRKLSEDETGFVLAVYEYLKNDDCYEKATNMLDDFFTTKFTSGKVDISRFMSDLNNTFSSYSTNQNPSKIYQKKRIKYSCNKSRQNSMFENNLVMEPTYIQEDKATATKMDT